MSLIKLWNFDIADYGINSILYQRGIYPPETFTHEQQYGLTLLVTTNDELVKYLNTVIGQVKSKIYDNLNTSTVQAW